MLLSGNVFEITKQTESLVESADLLDVQIPSQTHEKEQDDLLDNHTEGVENLPDEEKLTKLSTDAGFVKAVGPGQLTLHDQGYR